MNRAGTCGASVRRLLAVGLMAAYVGLIASVEGVSAVEASVAQTARSIWDGVYTVAQADRGQRVFVEVCGACHGDDLSGTEDGPSLKNAGFFARWRMKTLGTLVTTAMKTMPKGAPGTLSEKEYVDVASFILRVSGLPAGASELPPDIGTLHTIAVTDAPPK